MTEIYSAFFKFFIKHYEVVMTFSVFIFPFVSVFLIEVSLYSHGRVPADRVPSKCVNLKLFTSHFDIVSVFY